MNLITSLIKGLTSPLKMAKEKPVLFGGMVALVYFLGAWKGWWPNLLG